MSFGEAISALKSGKRVARKGWNGKNMFLFLWFKQQIVVYADVCKDPILKKISENNDGKVVCLPTICMKTADNKVLTGWLASQTDMLSDDWFVLE